MPLDAKYHRGPTKGWACAPSAVNASSAKQHRIFLPS
jgi:hypothetical protein